MSVLKLILLNPAKKIEVLKGHSISWCWAAIVWKNPWRNMFPRIPARKALCTGASQHPRSSSIRLAEDDDSQRFFFDRMTVSKLIKLIKLVVLPCNYTQRMISRWLSWFCWLLLPDQPALVMGGALPKPTFGQVSPTMPPTLGHLEDVCFQRQLYRILQMPDAYINQYIYI